MKPTHYLLDTNAISEAVKSKQNAGYMGWLNAADDTQMYVSCLTIGEIQKGISLTAESKARSKLNDYLTGLYEAFAGRILDLDVQDSVLWGELTAQAQQRGKTSPIIDTLLAAQCIRRNLILVTRNEKDFEQFTELTTLCPWSKI
jgi:predicted nucleic acid-binding protein